MAVVVGVGDGTTRIAKLHLEGNVNGGMSGWNDQKQQAQIPTRDGDPAFIAEHRSVLFTLHPFLFLLKISLEFLALLNELIAQ